MKALLSLLLLLSIAPSPVSAARGDLVSLRLRYHLSAEEAAVIASPYGKARSAYAVDVYEVVYRTLDGSGKAVDASGAVAVPVAAPPAPMVSIQHGTVFGKDQVPSRLPASWLGSELLFASSGYLTVMPDYVGYGVSKNRFHPYLHARSLAISIVDLLRATRTMTAAKAIAINGRLYLTGYSEGGYATLAAHRQLQEQHAGEFAVTASAPMAGPYDLLVTMEVLMQRGSPDSVPYLAFAFFAYDRIYDLNGLKGILREPYRSRVLKLFDQLKADPVGGLPARATEMFEPGFLSDWRGTGARQVKEAARENGLTGWTPAVPVALLHCTGDTVVPFENAAVAQAAFRTRGATKITLMQRDLGNHSTCFGPLTAAAKAFFDSLERPSP